MEENILQSKTELGNQIEALLFSSGKKMSVEQLSRLCEKSIDDIKSVLHFLRNDYNNKSGPLMVVEEGDSWKLTVREKYIPLVQNIIPETELTKSITETLAVIAWKMPILQSDVIKIRTNKAYDHIKYLEDTGFISKEKCGRTYMLKATQKFFEYFDLPNKKAVKDLFKNIEEIKKDSEKDSSETENIKNGNR